MEIKRKNIKHGDIVEIWLPLLQRFSYGKIIDPKKISEPIDLPYFIRVYNDIYEKPIQSIEALNTELLLAPFYIVGTSASVTKFHWRIVTNEKVSIAEEWIPDTKEGWPLFSNPPQKWGFKKRYSTHFIFSDWDKVRHLDNAIGKNIEVLPFLIELELLKNEGKDIRAHYNINNPLEEEIYECFNQLPVYTTLSEAMKGKAILN